MVLKKGFVLPLIWVWMINLLPLVFSSDSKYIITVPSEMRTGSQSYVNIIALGTHPSFTASVSILDIGDKVVVPAVMQDFVGSDYDEQRKVPLLIPPNLIAGKHRLKVESAQYSDISATQDVEIVRDAGLIMIQTDRGIYQPGHTVKIRVVILDVELKPLDKELDVAILNPKESKLVHWKNLQPDTGVIVREFQLADETKLGDWQITVWASDDRGIYQQTTFTVAEYVLPTFSVSVELPTILEMYEDQNSADIKFDVIARYTYGKPVKGEADVELSIGESNRPKKQSAALIEGKATFIVTVDRQTVVDYYRVFWYQYTPPPQILSIKANVEEENTGKVQSTVRNVTVITDQFKIEFVNMDRRIFGYGMPLNIFMKVTDSFGGPVREEDRDRITVSVSCEHNSLTCPSSLSMPATGDVIVTSVNIPSMLEMKNQTFSLKATGEFSGDRKVTFESKSLYMDYVKTKSNKGIQVVMVDGNGQVISPDQSLQADEMAHFQVMTDSNSNIFYEVYSKGTLQEEGIVDITANPSRIFSFTVTSDMAPDAVILVYTNTDTNEILAASLKFTVDSVLPHEVQVGFDRTEQDVGGSVTLTADGPMGSYCGIVAVDKSSLLLKASNDIDLAKVLLGLKKFDLTKSDEEDDGPRIMQRRKRRDVELLKNVYSGITPDQIIKDAGVIMATKSVIASVAGDGGIMVDDMFPVFAEAAAVPDANVRFKGANSEDNSASSEVRKYFPETWIWLDTKLGNSAYEEVIQVPDSITSWIMSAFVVDPMNGLDIPSSKATLTVFKRLFVTLDLPYSVVFGEMFKLNIYVFNYFNEKVDAVVNVAESLDFTVVPITMDDSDTGEHMAVSRTLSIPSNSSNGFFVWIRPQSLGRIKIHVDAISPRKSDRLEKELLVEPAGKTKSNQITRALDLKGQNLNFKMNATVDDEVVDGSWHMTVTLTGDIFGPVFNNLDGLVKMPYGCGEQNMISVTPNIFALKYMNAVKVVGKNELAERAKTYMRIGYQREQNYKQDDNSYSAFRSDKPGSTWLTSFVVKSFSLAKEFIPETVDEDDISKSVNWLLRQYVKDNNTFIEKGRVIHKEMQGGSADEMTLTTYVTLTLMEARNAMSLSAEGLNSTLSDVLQHLETYFNATEARLVRGQKYYMMSMLAYAFALGGRYERAVYITQIMKNHSNMEDGMMYWGLESESAFKDGGRFYCGVPAGPSDIETAGYMLLAYTKLNDQLNGRLVLKFLMSQFKEKGGFISTQDTVLGLQSVAEFAILLGTSELSISVDFTAGSETGTLTVDNDNRDILQIRQFPDQDLRTVNFDVTGKGLAMLSLAWKYNTKSTTDKSDKICIETRVEPVNTNTYNMFIDVCLTDTTYTGNMGLIEIGIPSGFGVDKGSVSGGSRFEMKDNKAVIYIQDMQIKKQSIRLESNRVHDVADIEGGMVSAYLYYDPDISTTVKYDPPDMVKLTACQLSGECPVPKYPSSAVVAMPTKIIISLMLLALLLQKY